MIKPVSMPVFKKLKDCIFRLVNYCTVDTCVYCHRELVPGEETICMHCLMRLPVVNSASEQNPLWSLLAGQVRFCYATTLAYYQPHDAFAYLIQESKFRDRPYVNAFLTRLLLQQLEGSGWPYDVDVIVPVPVHWRRMLKRGYNQVSPIVHTLSEAWNIPYEKRCLRRGRYVKSQLKANKDSRRTNEIGAFVIAQPYRLKGKHVLLIDDVCTTGSTLLACADALLSVEGVRVSFLTLGITLHV